MIVIQIRLRCNIDQFDCQLSSLMIMMTAMMPLREERKKEQERELHESNDNRVVQFELNVAKVADGQFVVII